MICNKMHTITKSTALILALMLILSLSVIDYAYAGSTVSNVKIDGNTLEELLKEADSLLAKHDKAAAMEKYKQIIDSCDAVLKTNPADTLLWQANYYKGRVLNELGQNEKAVACLKIAEDKSYRMIEKNKNIRDNKLAGIYYYLGRIQMAKGDKAGGIEYIKKALGREFNKEYSARLQKDPLFSYLKNTDEYYSLIDMALMIDKRLVMSSGLRVKNGIPLAPYKEIAESLGAFLEWDEAAKTITIKKFDKIIILQIGNKTAKVNGREVSLKVAPILDEKRYIDPVLKDWSIFVPVEFVAKELGQIVSREEVKVFKDYTAPAVVVREDESRVKYTEEQKKWAVAPSVNNYMYNYGVYHVIGGNYRFVGNVLSSRRALKEGWGIESREDLYRAIEWLENEGHTKSYRKMEAELSGENLKLLEDAINKGEELPFIYKLYINNRERLKDKGLIAWDYCRIVQITGWSYTAGYITIEEAYELCMDASRVIQKTYSSWEEMAEHYIKGYEFWSGEDRNEEFTEVYYRNRANQSILKDKNSPFNTLPWNLNLDRAD
ncbi:DUF1266 domain-containing protein [Lutispora sp.]|uniref:DUF1266 domain-containing protein n=1 Tax=Lutispora sp. TaxID=2828727 RepID=UPI002B20C90B|nr:DUF1266 domain-containing protein [Lutispora sp.]MEA4961719.1 DUF1266 domain-containing protein [Lutispora sp.]